MAKKKIKTFSVDEETYNSLVSMFKESGAEVSLSFFVDKNLKDLFKLLQAVRKVKSDDKRYTVPMSYIINEIARTPFIRVLQESELPDSSCLPGEIELDELQVKYEAENRKIPIEFWRYLRTGRFEMGPDNESIINKVTGNRYVLDEDGLPIEYKGDSRKGTENQ